MSPLTGKVLVDWMDFLDENPDVWMDRKEEGMSVDHTWKPINECLKINPPTQLDEPNRWTFAY